MQFYINPSEIKSGVVSIGEEDFRHIKKVLRLHVGDNIRLFDGKGKIYFANIIEFKASTVLVNIEERLEGENQYKIETHLAQALPKSDKMDLIVQKATELGITNIIPFLSNRTIPKIYNQSDDKRLKRWQKIALEASKQCLRFTIPKIEEITMFERILKTDISDCIKIIFCTGEQGLCLRDFLKNIHKKPERIFFIVGPEGGFSDEEVNQAVSSGFTEIRLGKTILRAETAPLTILSILQYEFGSFG